MMDKPTNKDYKVSTLAGEIQIKTEYLHGSIENVVTNMAKNYTGSNNMPLLTRDGHFGSRHKNDPAATRYIYTGKEKIFDKLFIKDDNKILVEQEFEGTKIEPRFMIPTLPLILLNGSEGIATGFASKILPRSLDNVKDYISSYINNRELPELMPYYKDFKGTITKGENNNQYLITGIFDRVSAAKLVITELPIGYNLSSYTKVLEDLEDKKVINSFKDLSDSKLDTFKFEITATTKFLKESDDYIIDKLKLQKKVTENFTVIDENNKVIAYNSPEEVINHYIKIKLEFNQKRKEYQLLTLRKKLNTLASKYIFVKNITENNITINKKKKSEIIEQLNTIDNIIEDNGSYDYLLNMNIYSLTEEKLQELLKEIKAKKEEFQELSTTSIESIWLKEIESIK
jgi:DNA topoisomerase-2